MLSSKNSNTKHKQHFCMNCLQGFTQESSRDQHQVYCKNNESVRVEMPKQGSTVEFKDGQNQFKVPFIMYADFESVLELTESPNPNPNQSYTNEVNQHTPSGWRVYSKFAYGYIDNPLRLYRGKDCIETFCNYIKEEAHRLYHMFPEKPMDPLTKKQWKKYKRSTKCHIYPSESKGKRSLSLHWSLQRSRALIMQFEVQNSILHPSCVSQFI